MGPKMPRMPKTMRPIAKNMMAHEAFTFWAVGANVSGLDKSQRIRRKRNPEKKKKKKKGKRNRAQNAILNIK